VARARANLAALATLRAIQQDGRPPTAEEQRVLARWSGWGAVPEVFDPGRADYQWAREQLAGLLSPQEMAAAARNTLNAHYTDAAIVRAAWGAVRDLGFTGGRVLEPGCGSGNFIAFAPGSAQLTGVEVDPVTAGIAAALHPHAQILPESFAATRDPDGCYDLAIGNVPFGKAALHDKRHNPAGHSIHNHFIIKSLHLVRAGGLVAVLTSRYTMDARNPAARREIAALADLVGAVRLPSGAHQRAAGTSVVTDLLILRRREPGREPDATPWEQARMIELDSAQVPVSEYFLGHPENVLGEMGAVSGAYRAGDLTVTASGGTQADFARALAAIVTDALQRGLAWTPAATPEPAATDDGRSEQLEGHLSAAGDGTFTKVVHGFERPHQVPRSQAAELRHLLSLRDTARALLDAEAASGEDTAQIGQLRRDLDRRYDAYLAAYGPLNRYSERRTGRTNPKTGQEIMARIRPPQGGFRGDPFAPLVYALEEFDPVGQRAAKTAIFRQRVVAPRAPRLGADTPADALAICLDTRGRADLAEIARLLGTTEADARQQLGTLVFEMPPAPAGDPGDLLAHAAADISALSGFSVTAVDITGQPRPVAPAPGQAPPGTLVPAAEYLSGKVRDKLRAAEQAAADDPRFAVNVAELRKVQPDDLTPGEIDARLGAGWIGADYVQQFLRETLDDPRLQVEHPGGQLWAVRGNDHTVLATSTWGTSRYPAPALAQAILEQRRVEVRDTIRTPDGERRVLNLEETLAAQEKATELGERFAGWAWEDPDRAAGLARIYNERFNNLVLRSYDDAELSLPGLSVSFEPRPHQTAAVARMIHEPSVGLFHEVGAGKTAEMIMGVTELRRLGLIRKPAVVVPNHMLEQFAREWLQLYPQARVLVAGREDLQRDRRRAFVARCATGDWDGIVISRSAFEKIPLSPAEQQAYMDHELDLWRKWLTAARENEGGGGGLTVKRLEGALLRAEERLKARLDSAKDPGITFEATGIDYLCVDEAHGYKNLRTLSNIPDAAIDGSMRASDLDMKISYLRRRNGTRVVTFATATPIANSVTEAYVMQRYLRPDLLDAAGIEVFDTWAATFGEVVTQVELAPEGGSSFRMKSRFAKFRNVPEMLRMLHVCADIKTAEDLALPVPQIATRDDGQRAPQTVTVEPSPHLLSYVADLGKRAEMVRNRMVSPDEDNMLKISGDGRRAALDLRLAGLPQQTPRKAEAAAGRIAAIWQECRDRSYLTPDGRAYPARGALQLVFCDLGTPGDGWNVYDELHTQLAARGVPPDAVRFIHEARTDRDKARLFAACRSGRVAVLAGSTEKMGVGTNVQDRAIALHHLDAPWRPADVAQREGRIVRQGNLNPEVQIYRWVTEGSFDGYMWQTLERKARFISQVIRGRLDAREIGDIGDTALSYSEVKALATGNPLLMDKADADAALARLQRSERAHARNQNALTHALTRHQHDITRLTGLIGDLDAAIGRRQDTRGDQFVMTVDGRAHGNRAVAGQHLKHLLQRQAAELDGPHVTTTTPGQLGGFPVTAAAGRVLGTTTVTVGLDGAPGTSLRLDEQELGQADPAGLITRLENRLARLEEEQAGALAGIGRAQREIAHAQDSIGKPFPQAGQLAAARERARRISQELDQMAASPQPESQPVGATSAGTQPPPAPCPAVAREPPTPAPPARAGARECEQCGPAASGRGQASPDGRPYPGARTDPALRQEGSAMTPESALPPARRMCPACKEPKQAERGTDMGWLKSPPVAGETRTRAADTQAAGRETEPEAG
jgi:N12 class adenine-specific DNA methylase